MRRWDALIDSYLCVCKGRGLAQSTVEKRERELVRFGCWLKRRRPKPKLERVDRDLIIQYIRDRTSFHSKATVRGVISELRCVGEFLVQRGIWLQNPVRWIQGPKFDQRQRLPKRIDRAQLLGIWDAARHRRNEYTRHWAICILSILYGTGLRRGELIRLNMCDWNREEGILTIDGRKTGCQRRIPVPKGVWSCIEAYLPYRHNLLEKTFHLEETALLVNRKGERIRAENLSTLVQRLAQNAGVSSVTPHQFRHSCASDLLEGGVSLPEVQKILGHAAIMSTMRYVDIADPERQKAMALHPIKSFLVEQEGEDHVTT